MDKGEPKVVSMPMSRERVTDIIREIAKDSNRWPVVVPYEETDDWRKKVNRRQIGLCLREGYVLEDRVSADENGYWRFHVARVCSGLDVTIEIALEPDGPNRKAIIIGISGDRIEV